MTEPCLTARDDSGRNTDCQCDEQRQCRQFGGDRQLLGDQIGDRALDADRLAEIAVKHPLKP